MTVLGSIISILIIAVGFVVSSEFANDPWHDVSG